MATPLPEPIKFTRNKKFLAGTSSASVEITAVKDPETLAALALNAPFPKEVTLESIKLSAETGKDISFDGKSGTVSFKASADVFSGLGVYTDTANLLKDLKLGDDISAGFDVGADPDAIFIALRWGYDASAKTQGSIALGAGASATFSGEASRDAAYAVVRRFPKGKGSRDALEETVNSWMLPAQISSPDDLTPATWLIASVDGSIAAQLGIKYGFDYNWVRKLKAGGLSGDIGFKINLAVSAALGFNASGKYAVVVGRESDAAADQRLRLRLFKQRQHGWDINFDAGADVQADPTDPIPANPDDFFKAVFGIHGGQILKELDTWTGDPDKLPATLAGKVEGYAEKLLTAVTGIDLDKTLPDLQKRIDAARAKFTGFITQWRALPQRVAALLQKVVSDGLKDEDKLEDALKEIRDLSQKIAASDLDAAKQLLQGPLADVDFFRTPAGQWLETSALNGILNVLSSNQEFQRLQQIAAQTSKVLDEGEVEDVLKKFQKYVDDQLNLDKIIEIANSNSLDLMKDYELLKARLEAFLEKELDIAALKQIAAAIKNFRDKGQDYYEAAYKALTKKYGVHVSAAYQSSSTSEALLDVTFDLNQPAAIPFYSDAVDGKFDKLFLRQQTGVTIREARLSHSITRHTHVEIHLPHYDQVADHLNSSFASVSPRDDEEGRVLVYELNAKDIATVKNRLNSTLAVGGFWKLGVEGVRVHTDPDDPAESLSYAYSLRMVRPDMGVADLEYLLTPYAKKYFPSLFGGDRKFGDWLAVFDQGVESVLKNGPGQFGKTLLSLQLSYPAEVTAGWLNAPKDKKDKKYVNMSKHMQARLKELVPYLFFQNPNRYRDNNNTARGVLVYAALPPTANLVGDPPITPAKETDGDIYWDVGQSKYVNFMLNRQETVDELKDILTGIVQRLTKTPGFGSVVGDYDNTGKILSAAGTDFGMNAIKMLLRSESKFVNDVRSAAVRLANFREQAPDKPEQAVDELSKFGSGLTATFNTPFGGNIEGDKIRPLMSLLFAAAAAEFSANPALANARPNATLEIIVLKDASTFDLGDYLDGKLPPKEDVVAQTRLVDLA